MPLATHSGQRQQWNETNLVKLWFHLRVYKFHDGKSPVETDQLPESFTFSRISVTKDGR
jgi:hypothetical protein